MKIILGADHGGFELKEILKSSPCLDSHQLEDVGTHSSESVDYPDVAEKVTAGLINGSFDLGILICGTGIGMSIAANRDRRIRAANCHDEYTARMSREHNDANILCLGARVLSAEQAFRIVEVWLTCTFSGGRHQRRIDKFSEQL